MPSYKIVFLDIDGTILQPDHTIQDSTKSAIQQLQDQDIEVFLATGRPLHEIKELGKELNITSFIAYNGAYAIYERQEVFKETMPPEQIYQFLDIANQNEHQLVLYTHEQNVFTTFDNDVVQQFIETFHLKLNAIYEPSIDDKVLGITIITDQDQAGAHYQDHFKDIHLTVVNVAGLTDCLDVIRDHVNKGVAVKAVLERLGLPPESSIAFGDGMNDKEMLMTVGEGFAMGNGHPDLFKHAKHQTTDVKHDGIFNGLKSLGLVK
ncbi:Cof subfamily protein (haloacid dehalogenase superfamily) [Bacillus mesophilus]|uniref:HAD family phosphatase n=1 Tax=Bacillus mesophilus TaxID=1808955 RepID=A0A6M0QDT3_9BACI|nr:HAD family hydrolase [Bacillus mesophilus]MBM7660117.1 Cof subfamily protein (haloacid dehalogenase superfamily) [Bacillus mesophilus]NEY73770.1 HAD family phosphatase [Bacillus mesophilus]